MLSTKANNRYMTREPQSKQKVDVYDNKER